ncbi:dTDP-4-dehydrorhamnose reductase [Pseudomonas sp. 10B238]|jgi:dTDP-4-dehydrorhamnose reductase|uniref:dTDP-4-dehydrorhamnose reductase n=1 Tax=Pseudomonadaceae TaxID=135621 RepID=UPI0006183370|nr:MULTISPECIES: dTDP-4-dehydrorhamnose reductase [Pseudomonadaceae]MAL37484.1 dTDP-4-dehydrorhamnose reductase [Pseudomonas sp.]KJJ61946.1 dTDP-4-dehydrorhamnose reductase [Pseudomonas sp. 10B238]MBK3796941.1 dTDP-4-dehydrorhamnose reductase [Stutzerimonas stutzeri]MBK3877444.1 dTDP-4-dehydrorhamnose reductase [Stutzerimonas stutzeri]HBM09177.1 dTDP-4-dehydrorhamnose reductase [Pseudomonas sp.]|tara:strand:- start:11840 stop:12739 length:900 start_codon:yes stop_codon:yes gene_type:complete
MKILLLGKNGQVGWELQRALAPIGRVVALDREGGDGLCGDLADIEGLRLTIKSVQPDIIVNAAAYTAVDKAENEEAKALQINHEAPKFLAEEMLQLNGWLVHYSTDYVFDGSGEKPWREDDATAPLSIYGKSKLLGEQAIESSGCKHVIFRTSWVYGAHGNNFAKTMLRLAGERDHLQVIDDQIGAPTGADLLADVTAHALHRAVAMPELAGLYHLTSAGETSWYDYARFIVSSALSHGIKLKIENISPISTSEYQTCAQRPRNSRLDTRKLVSNFGLHLPMWQDGITRLLKEVSGNRQ